MSNLRPKTLAIIDKANEIISQYDIPLTVRQIYYRFVGEQLIENSLKSYKNLARILARAREDGLINFESIIDRFRPTIKPSSWRNPKDFFETVKIAYRRELLVDQDKYIEVWVEKDALVGVFEQITAKYDINLVVGRGYPSHSALYEASKRFNGDKTNRILYFGDFDPSGEDIYRDVQERMGKLFGTIPLFEKVSLTTDDIKRYNLPPNPSKQTDSRTKAHIEKYGDVSVELDALPPDILVQKIEENIQAYLDLSKFEKQKSLEVQDKIEIIRLIGTLVEEETEWDQEDQR